jgi:hypothetical protein
MADDIAPFGPRKLREIDSNSLLRMYDLATGAVSKAASLYERTRAEQTTQRIVKELQRRNVLPSPR